MIGPCTKSSQKKVIVVKAAQKETTSKKTSALRYKVSIDREAQKARQKDVEKIKSLNKIGRKGINRRMSVLNN